MYESLSYFPNTLSPCFLEFLASRIFDFADHEDCIPDKESISATSKKSTISFCGQSCRKVQMDPFLVLFDHLM